MQKLFFLFVSRVKVYNIHTRQHIRVFNAYLMLISRLSWHTFKGSLSFMQ